MDDAALLGYPKPRMKKGTNTKLSARTAVHLLNSQEHNIDQCARFHQHVATHGTTAGIYSSVKIDRFFNARARDVRLDTTKQFRYLKLIDRVSRYHVAMEVRKIDHASLMLVNQDWPEDQPTPVFLLEADNKRLLDVCVAPADASFKHLRSVAIVALYLGTGIALAACRQLDVDDRMSTVLI